MDGLNRKDIIMKYQTDYLKLLKACKESPRNYTDVIELGPEWACYTDGFMFIRLKANAKQGTFRGQKTLIAKGGQEVNIKYPDIQPILDKTIKNGEKISIRDLLIQTLKVKPANKKDDIPMLLDGTIPTKTEPGNKYINLQILSKALELVGRMADTAIVSEDSLYFTTEQGHECIICLLRAE